MSEINDEYCHCACHVFQRTTCDDCSDLHQELAESGITGDENY